MEEYTLVNRFMERFRTRGCRRVRSKEGQILENFVLKKKRDVRGRMKKKEPMKGYRSKGTTYAGAL
jgi:hypothetical protein